MGKECGCGRRNKCKGEDRRGEGRRGEARRHVSIRGDSGIDMTTAAEGREGRRRAVRGG